MLNTGVSFGLLPGVSPVLHGIVLLVLIIYALKMRELWGRIGVGLIIFGGTGNLVSRLVSGGIVDNLDFFGLFYNNIWDWIIGIGVVVYLIQYWYGNTRNF